MARTIWKFPVRFRDRQGILMPTGAVVRSVMIQRDEIYLWAEVDPFAPDERRYFEVFGTGHEIPDDGQRTFLGSVMTPDGAFVWHVYERNGTT